MKFYLSKEIMIEGRKNQAVYLNGELQKVFDVLEDNFVERHNDYIDTLRALGYKSEKQRREV